MLTTVSLAQVAQNFEHHASELSKLSTGVTGIDFSEQLNLDLTSIEKNDKAAFDHRSYLVSLIRDILSATPAWVQAVNLNYNSFSDYRGADLSCILGYLKYKIKALHIRDCGLGKLTIDHFLNAIDNMKLVKELDIARNDLYLFNEHLVRIFESFAASDIEILGFEGNLNSPNLSHTINAEQLCKAIEKLQRSKITTLFFGFNNLHIYYYASLEKLFKIIATTKIERLSLRGNLLALKFSTEKLCDLFKILQASKIKNLDISGNEIEKKPVEDQIRIYQALGNIEHVVIGSCEYDNGDDLEGEEEDVRQIDELTIDDALKLPTPTIKLRDISPRSVTESLPLSPIIEALALDEAGTITVSTLPQEAKEKHKAIEEPFFKKTPAQIGRILNSFNSTKSITVMTDQAEDYDLRRMMTENNIALPAGLFFSTGHRNQLIRAGKTVAEATDITSARKSPRLQDRKTKLLKMHTPLQ